MSFRAYYVSGADLYAEMGIDHDDLIRQNPAYVNTCAARVSLALLKSNVPFAGRLRIRKGPYEGRLIETGAKLCLLINWQGPTFLAALSSFLPQAPQPA